MPGPASPPRFLPQALAIVIPLTILTAVALGTLRQDARMAVARARTQAEELAPLVASYATTALLSAAQDALLARQAWEARALQQLGLNPDQLGLEPLFRGLPSEPEHWSTLLEPWLQAQPEATSASHEALPPILVWHPADAIPPDPPPFLQTDGIAPWLASLKPSERRRWHTLQQRSVQSDPSAPADLLRREWATLATNAHPPELRAVAAFEALRLESPPAGSEAWLLFIQEHGAVPTPAGVPLAVAATMELLSRTRTQSPPQPPPDLVAALVQTLRRCPSPFNPNLIQAARAAFPTPSTTNDTLFEILVELDALQARSRHALRQLPLAALRSATNAFQWTPPDGAAPSHLACTVAIDQNSAPAPDPSPSGTPPRFVVLLSRPQVEAALRHALIWARLPPWAGVRIDLAGQSLDLHLPGDILARAPVPGRTTPSPSTGDRPDTGFTAGLEPWLEAAITLADPDLLLADVVRRQRLYGSLVLAVAAVAGVGLWQARRSFRRQLQLTAMKSGFVSSVSHELRTPIASIRLLAEGLERDTVTAPDQRRDYLRFIVQECRRLSGLIENVLDHARIEQGRKQYEFEPADAARLVQDTVRLMEPCATAADVTLTLDLPPAGVPLPDALWDAGAIQQALVNLIDNAIKHSPPDTAVHIRLTLDHLPNSASSPVFHIAVSDRGPGIPAADQEKIFDPFYRRGSELRRETRGIGIGLSLVRHTVEAHGGRVRIDSTPGTGSTFTLELPAGTPSPHPASDR